MDADQALLYVERKLRRLLRPAAREGWSRERLQTEIAVLLKALQADPKLAALRPTYEIERLLTDVSTGKMFLTVAQREPKEGEDDG